MVSVLNTLGVGSGIDTTALIDALVAAERSPRDTVLTARSSRVDARISGFAQVRSGLSALATALAARTRGGALGPLPSSSDATIAAASATNGATPLLSPVALEVRTLAGGQTLVSAALASTSATPVGTGVLTLRFGTMTDDGQGGFAFAGNGSPPVDVTIDATNNSLTGLRDAINAAQAGIAGAIQASVIVDATGARLVLKGPSGAAAAFIVTADPVPGDPRLDAFVHTPAVSTMTRAGTAHDASLVVDGVAVTRATNNFSDLIAGVTLDLRHAAPGTTIEIAATRDADGLKSAVRDLVAALTAVTGVIGGLVRAGNESDAAGALAGDASMRRVRAQLAALTAMTAGTPAPGAPARLADLGITTARNGSFALDETRLGAAVAANPDGVEALLVALTATGVKRGPLTTISAGLDSSSAAGGATDRYLRESSAIARERSGLDLRMTTYRATLVRQYAAMEAAVAASNSTRSFLEAQIKAWNQTRN